MPRAKRNRLIAELIAAVELTQWADKPVKNLSCAAAREIARGLVHEPKVFFLDEPMTGLDPSRAHRRVGDAGKIVGARPDGAATRTTWTRPTSSATASIVDHGKLVALDTPAGLKASIPGASEKTTLDDVFVHYAGRDLRDALQAPSAADSPFMIKR